MAQPKINIYKIFLIGDTQVGKTNFILRYTENQFLPESITTIGVDFKSKNISRNDKKIKLQLWDTAGQERFRSVTINAYKNSNCVVLLYSIDSRHSFENISEWAAQIEAGSSPDIVKILVGNKCDLPDELREVSYEEGKQMADRVKMKFFEASALTPTNVNETFDYAVDELLKKQLLNNGGKGLVVSADSGKKCCK